MYVLNSVLVLGLFQGLCLGQGINTVIKQIQPKITPAVLAKFLPQLQRQLQLQNSQLQLEEKAANASLPWSYDIGPGNNGPDEWDSLEANWTCDGSKQSPIDIQTAQVMRMEPNPGNLNVRVEPDNVPITGELKNNGYAPTLTVGEEVTVKLTGGTLTEDYFLKQFHFHFGCNETAGSEHTIDGNFYPVEMHLVFWDNGNYQRFEEAAQGENGLAVIAVLFEKENENIEEPATITSMEKLIQMMAEIEEENSGHMVTKSANIHLNEIVPSLMSLDFADRFFQYHGSLTTPGCYESVTWFVMNSHPKITEKQLTALRQLKSSKVHRTTAKKGKMCDNTRPIQPLGGRQIHSNIVP